MGDRSADYGGEPMRVSVVMDLVAQLAIQDGAAPMTRWPNGWERKLDDHWTIFVNGGDEPLEWHHLKVPRFHCAVEFNGWPAGLFNPFDGCLAAGAVANEDALVARLRSLVEPERAG